MVVGGGSMWVLGCCGRLLGGFLWEPVVFAKVVARLFFRGSLGCCVWWLGCSRWLLWCSGGCFGILAVLYGVLGVAMVWKVVAMVF